ncbi:MAG: CdaR family protein [Bacteroidales bacterium]
MDSTLLKQFNIVVNREKAKLNKRLAIFLFFLFISTILWFLIKLSHEYTTDLDYPIQLVNPQKGKVIVGAPPRTLQLRVKAYGFTLLRYKFIALLNPLQINLKSAKLNRNSDGSEYFVVMSDKFTSFVSQLSDDIVLLGVQPDTLYFNMTNVIDKEVAVKPDISATYANQYMLAGPISVKPQTITITGPSSIVDTIYEVKTQKLMLNLLAESSKVKVTLASIQQVAFSQNDVKIDIPVEKFTETTLDVPLVPLNVPENAQVILLPEKVTIKCNITVSKYFLLKPNQFRLVCDFSDVDAISGGKIRITVAKHPDYVARIDFQPKYVDFIIKSK